MQNTARKQHICAVYPVWIPSISKKGRKNLVNGEFYLSIVESDLRNFSLERRFAAH